MTAESKAAKEPRTASFAEPAARRAKTIGGKPSEAWAPAKLGTWALAAAVLAVGGLAWWLQTRPGLVVDPSPLATLPRTVGTWQSEELPLESAVESILRADFNLQRAYFPASGTDPVWVYIGYYGTERGGRPEHVPRGCFTGNGWDIASARVIGAEDGSERRMNEYRVERAGERQLVHFWYRSSRRTGMIGGVDQRLDQILGRIQTGRADGALIRVSMTVGRGGEAEARTRLLSFGSELDRQLARYWPVEHPREGR
jgi:EpsI family protein